MPLLLYLLLKHFFLFLLQKKCFHLPGVAVSTTTLPCLYSSYFNVLCFVNPLQSLPFCSAILHSKFQFIPFSFPITIQFHRVINSKFQSHHQDICIGSKVTMWLEGSLGLQCVFIVRVSQFLLESICIMASAICFLVAIRTPMILFLFI